MLVPSIELQSNLVYARVEWDHGSQRDPEVPDLQDAVEQCVIHVLHVTLTVSHRTIADEVLPTDYWREKHRHWNRPRHNDDTQHLMKTTQSKITTFNYIIFPLDGSLRMVS